MDTPRGSSTERPHPARRDVLRYFGLAAAGVIAGSYAAPAMASFRPPAGFVGSSDVLFVSEGQRIIACDGPAATYPAGANFSLRSLAFDGTVTFDVVPTAPTTGWTIALDKPLVELAPGSKAFVHLVMDCYADGQPGADPKNLKVRLTAIGRPSDGSPAFTIGTLTAQAKCTPSKLSLIAPDEHVTLSTQSGASTNVTVIGESIDSSTFGPVLVEATAHPSSVTVAIESPALAFQGNGTFVVPVRVRVPVNLSSQSVSVEVRARLDHPSFPAPMIATDVIVLDVIDG